MGAVGGDRRYDGPGLGWAPWKCPSCAQENTGLLDEGCVHCGSGSARPSKVGQPPPKPAPPLDDLHLAYPALRALAEEDREEGIGDPVYLLASEWIVAHPEGSAIEAFVAGYHLATAQARARTMIAAPVTTDLPELAPEGKPRRTIIAALELFKDQVLRDATEEIASGEWCSIEEVEALIAQLRQEE